MAGWILVIICTILSVAAIIALGRLPRHMWVLPSAAGALALAGYAYQGRPDLDASLAKPITSSLEVSNQLIEIRQEMDSNFGAAKRYLILSDSAAQKGKYDLAAAFLQNGLKKYPNDPELWAALGLQIMFASDGQISAPAKFAFDRSRKAWPKGPVPDYFEGLMALFEGKVDVAETYWKNALENATEKAKYRATLEQQLAQLQLLKTQSAQAKP